VPHLEENFLRAVKDYTAGDPMRPDVKWTNLTLDQIAERLAEAGTPVSVTVVKQLLRKHRYIKRKARKSLSMGQHADRNRQFETIARLKRESLESDNPILSIDTKKKELVGNFYREGRLYTQETIETFDHDFPSFASGVIIPHGLYDVKRNDGHVNLGTSHDTSEFACDSIERWWESRGRAFYPRATSILLLCDGGGSNSASQYLFKEDLQRLVDRIGIEIRVAHYPPYTSKYNPIEHRLFPHLTRACQGVIFESVELVKGLMERAKTSTGLRVTVDILDKVYQTGRRYAEGFKENMKIVFDEILPKWNYRVVPSGS
jgi:Rhodopirellula transposase DDE domain